MLTFSKRFLRFKILIPEWQLDGVCHSFHADLTTHNAKSFSDSLITRRCVMMIRFVMVFLFQVGESIWRGVGR
jgi:hypothetical protein